MSRFNNMTVTASASGHAGWKRSFLLLMVLPALGAILIFSIYPGLVYIPAAFKNWTPPRPLSDADWVGLKWFLSILNYYGLPELIRNSVILGIWDIALLPIPMILALACQHSDSRRIKKVLDVFLLIPVFIPSAVIVAVTQKILSTEGLLNQFLGLFGVAAENHLLKGNWFYAYFSLSGLWSGIGFSYLVYRACLSASRQELHDAAQLDGAGLFTRILRIDLPLCRSTFLVNLTFQIVNILSTNTERLLLFKNNANSAYATTLDLYAYELTFKASVMGDEDVDVYLYPYDTMEAEMLGIDMQCIIPLDELITPENTPNICAILEANPGLKEQITASDGHIYTLFTNDAYQPNAYTQKLWVNRNFLEKYTAETGKELPATTAEFEQMLVYFNTHDMNGDGEQNEIPYIGQTGVEGVYNLFGSFLPSNSSSNGYGCYRTEDGQLVFAYNQDAFKDALAYVRGLYAQGLISPDTFTINVDDRYVYTSGSKSAVRAGVVAAVTADQVVRLSEDPDTMTYDDYVALPPLEGPNGVRTIVSAGETAVSLRNAITTKCDDPVAAIRWLDAGYSETARMYAVYGGLEGEGWAYAEGETINGAGQVITSLVENQENVCWAEQGIVYSITEQDYLAMDASQIATNAALATYRANLAYRPYMVPNEWPSIVWVGDKQDKATEYSELGGLINKAVSEYFTAVILGDKNLEQDWDAYIQTLNDIGVDRFVELVDLYAASAA